MSRYRHPHLVRGTVHTSKGAFAISRGVVELPDHIAAAFGWVPIDAEPGGASASASSPSSDTTAVSGPKFTA